MTVYLEQKTIFMCNCEVCKVIFKNKKQFIRHNYTIIELLVVLVIAGLLTGMTVSGIKGALARQGATGAVRTLATKISLAQSLAVSKNQYVALLIPDDDGFNGDLDGSTQSNNPIAANTNVSSLANYLFTQNRICYVTKDTSGANPVYKFNSWVRGYEWQKLPSKTIAFIVSETGSTATPNENSYSAQVTNIEGSPGKNSSAIIFKPSGALINAKQVIIRAYRAAYLPSQAASNFIWQNGKDTTKGWKIGINGFTGRTKFCLGGENVAE